MKPKNLLIIIFFIISSCFKTKGKDEKNQDYKTEEQLVKKNYSIIHEQALVFCKTNNLNSDYYILIDMSLHSGNNRFFVYDFKTKKNVYEKLVTHGSCDVFSENLTKWNKAKMSNTVDSHCTAFGKYKIGSRETSSWGIGVKYWLKGLESTNNNSEKRITVLHSWSAVSDSEIYPKYSPLSWGCPAVSDDFMTILDKKLKVIEKPVLLWIVQ